MTAQNSCAMMVVREDLHPPPTAFKKAKKAFLVSILPSQAHFLFRC